VSFDKEGTITQHTIEREPQQDYVGRNAAYTRVKDAAVLELT